MCKLIMNVIQKDYKIWLQFQKWVEKKLLEKAFIRDTVFPWLNMLVICFIIRSLNWRNNYFTIDNSKKDATIFFINLFHLYNKTSFYISKSWLKVKTFMNNLHLWSAELDWWDNFSNLLWLLKFWVTWAINEISPHIKTNQDKLWKLLSQWLSFNLVLTEGINKKVLKTLSMHKPLFSVNWVLTESEKSLKLTKK